ncbi:MAG: acetate/propionate family kinase [Planctomycetes bacterium]|nr:acetate/propionate family kinase [Planctomycetota bacterium]
MTRLLVVNTGSSSLKWTVLTEDLQVVAGADEPWQTAVREGRRQQTRAALARAPAFDHVAHRIVHGGTRFRGPVRIDADVRARLEELVALAPEHMRVALDAVDACCTAFPDAPALAVFDTAFHATLGEAAAGYGLPFEWSERFGLVRFGFHGLSVAYAVERARALLGVLPARLIVCHLGSGSSITAVEHGRSIDTTMGFSPLEGVMMATRSGSLDPGLVLYLQQHCGIGLDELRETLASRSGLRGVSGLSGDLREILAAADRGDARAQLAYERFVLSLVRAVGALTAVLRGVDAIVFTGGIGENSARVRRDVARSVSYCGLQLSDRANVQAHGDADVASPDSRGRILVVRAREDLAIQAALSRMLESGAASAPAVD